MKFNNLGVGDDFIETVAEQLKKDNNLQKYHLSNNKLTTRGAIAIFNKVSDSSQIIDISFNPDIKRDAYKFLSRYVLQDYRKKISELDLEGNQLDDKSLVNSFIKI